MIALQTVLCPVDFSPVTPRQVDLAAELCRAFGARLVLHHNRNSMGNVASVGWMWNADHPHDSQATVEAKLRECLSRLPEGIRAEPLLTEGPLTRAVLAAGDLVNADLIVLTAHGTMADDHASVTRQVLESQRRAALVLHEPAIEARTPRFATPSAEPQIVVAPIDLQPTSQAALETALDLARRLSIELHLLHVLSNGLTTRRRSHDADDDARGRLRALVPEELADRVKVDVEHGDVARGIATAAERLAAACIVMGEHRTSLRRWFGRDNARIVLQEAHCPVWYVPGDSRAAAPTRH